MSDNDRHDFAKNTAAALRKQADRVERIDAPVSAGPWVLPFNDLDSHFRQIKEDIQHVTAAGDRCVYVFRLTDPAALGPLRSAMETIEQNKKAKTGEFTNVAKYNSGAADGETLYVGSSFATANRKHTLVTRLAQHLGLSNKTTYAMHLAAWATGLPGGVQISVYQYPIDTCRDDISAIEDHLSASLDPILGRRGRAR